MTDQISNALTLDDRCERGAHHWRKEGGMSQGDYYEERFECHRCGIAYVAAMGDRSFLTAKRNSNG